MSALFRTTHTIRRVCELNTLTQSDGVKFVFWAMWRFKGLMISNRIYDELRII